MKIALRLVITALILASVGFGVFYYFTMPDGDLSTYYTLVANDDKQLAIDLNLEIAEVTASYSTENPSMTYANIVNDALTHNYNYYKTLLLSVINVGSEDQINIDAKINEYEAAKENTLLLVNNFNDFFETSGYDPATPGIDGAYTNFINAYNNQILVYYDLVVLMKSYVINYAFNTVEPISLNNTLLNVLLDSSKVVITQKLFSPENSDAMAVYLNDYSDRYASFTNSQYGFNATISGFISAYENLADKDEFFVQIDRNSYIANMENVDQQNYATTVHSFLERADYNL